MSAVELLEKLGTSAELQREDSEQGQRLRQLAEAAVEQIQTPIDQWCGIVPAEDEDDTQKDKEEEELDTSLSYH
jgi:hypothetical protein